MKKKYIQHKNLFKFCDISSDYFKSRMYIELFEGQHFIILPTTSITKKIILWDVEELEKWFRSKISNDESEINALLSRKR